MRVNVSGIPEAGLQRELKLPITVNDSERPDVAHVFIKIFRFAKRVIIEGSVNISVSLKCSRCLNEFFYPLNAVFMEEYNPAEDIGTEDEQELTNEELDIGFYRNDEIDVSEVVKEQVLLSVPMKPLCKTECRGMCSRCGKDLNKGPCKCEAEKIDPRLAPLEKFRKLIKDRKE